MNGQLGLRNIALRCLIINNDKSTFPFVFSHFLSLPFAAAGSASPCLPRYSASDWLERIKAPTHLTDT